MTHRALPLLWLLCVGCGFPEPDPGPVVIPDDDDTTDGDGDDDDAADDDDVADDDDGTGQSLRAWATLTFLDTLGAGGLVTGTRYEAIASLGVGGAIPFGDPGDLDGFPLPGSSLHPEHDDRIDLCEEITSAEGTDPLPLTLPVGAFVSFVPTGVATTLQAPETGGVYSLVGDGAPESDTWALGVKGGAEWRPSMLPAVFSVPEPVTDPLPGPGNLGNLAAIQVRWTALDDPGGVEILMFRWLTANQTQWAAVRCRSADDGEMFVGAGLLAPGNGDIVVTLSRASWVSEPLQSGEDVVQPHLGAVRSVRYLLTPG